jgi:hypothetical protein
MLSTRRCAVLAASGSLVLALACIDFQHTNPFDPAVPLQVTIRPETLFSVGGVIQFTFATVPPLTDPEANWLGGSSHLSTAPLGSGGVFYSTGAPLWPQTEIVPMTIEVGRADINHHTDYRKSFNGSVVITQRLVRIQARCPGVPACDVLSVGASTSVFVDGYDALGSGIAGLSDPTANPLTVAPIATFTVRDTTIATAASVGMRVATVTAKRTGATWMVAQRDSLRDSLRLIVR